MAYLLDTNILLRLVGSTDRDHVVVRAALETIRQQGEQRYFFPQNLVEFWNVCTRPLDARGGFGLTLAETDRAARLIERLFTMLPEELAVHDEWRRIVVEYKVQGAQVHDARIVAAMNVHGVTHILTLNTQDFARYPEIAAVHPNSLL